MTRLVLVVAVAIALIGVACSKKEKSACHGLAAMVCASSGESSHDCVKAKEMADGAKDAKTIDACTKVVAAFNTK